MRNIEALRSYFLGKDPQLKETLADNSLRLIGIEGKHFVLRTELIKAIEKLENEIQNADKDLNDRIDRNAEDIAGLITWKDNTDFVLDTDLAAALADYYTKSQVDALLQIIPRFTIEVVEQLPTEDISLTTLYLVPSQDPLQSNAYDEFIYVNNTWEQVGTTAVDMSDYYTKEEVDSKAPFKTITTDWLIIENSAMSPFLESGWYYTGNHNILYQSGGNTNTVVYHDTFFYYSGGQPEDQYFYLLPVNIENMENQIDVRLYFDVFDSVWKYAGYDITDDIAFLKQNPNADLTKVVPTANAVDALFSDKSSSPLSENPIEIINPEYFYRFKNLVENSSFEVFDGQTLVPYGWTGATVTADAAMFGTYSMKIEPGDTAQVVSKNQPDITWTQGAYDTTNLILAFYHKFGGVNVKIYDIDNANYLQIQQLDSETLEPVGSPSTTVSFSYKANWNRYRGFVKVVPASGTKKVRLEFTCPANATREVYIDGVSLEPYTEGEFPSIYKDGRYSLSAYQLLEPPTGDATRWINLDHFSIANSVADADGNITYQELLREDGSLAIKRQASNPDSNGNYQTYVETFYLTDGVTINYVDTYTYTYSSSGAITSKTRTTTEV